MAEESSFVRRKQLAGTLAWLGQILWLVPCQRLILQREEDEEDNESDFAEDLDALKGAPGNEIELLSLLKDLQDVPGTAPPTELMLAEPDPFADFVLQVVPGVPLSALLSRDGALSEDRARPIFVGLLKALHSCHCRRVCHQNVRPESLVVVERPELEPHVVLTDFSSAAPVYLSGSLGEELLDEQLLDEYVPPEVLEGYRQLGDMVDIWATGLCCHEMLAGGLPWRKGRDLRMEILGDAEVNSLDVSHEARMLLNGLLQRSVLQRSLVVEAMRHAWCRIAEEEQLALFIGGPTAKRDRSFSHEACKGDKRCPTLLTSAAGSSAGSLARRGAWPKSWRSRHL